MVETTSLILGLLIVFGIAISVRFLTNRITVPYTVLLIAVGFSISLADIQAYIGFTLAPLFTYEIILFVFLPAIVLRGAARVDYSLFQSSISIIGTVVLIGLPVAVLAIGWLGSQVFGLPLLIILLFGAMAYPIDPVAVLSLFEQAGAPARLEVLVEGESLLDDGLAIVVFSAVLALVENANPAELTGTTLLTIEQLTAIVGDFLVVSIGGVVVGLVIGYGIHLLYRATNDRQNLFMLSLVAAYGSFFIGEHVLHVSGILATVVAGLIVGTYRRQSTVSKENHEFLYDVWDAMVFILETILFLAIGLQVSGVQILNIIEIVLGAFLLLVVARAGVVYGLINLLNQIVEDPVPLSYQHVIIWGGMHGVIPIALALSLEPTVPYHNQLRTMVFGVVIASMLIQGILMSKVLKVTGVVESCQEEA